MNVLVIDIGGTSMKLLASGQSEARKVASGPTFTPDRMVAEAKAAVADWKFDVVSIGFPAPVRDGRLVADPWNMGPGWVGFDFAAAFGRPVRLINDAAMQALGAHKGGKMLFLGLGTGLGSCMIAEHVILPMELGHLPYKDATFEDYVGIRGLNRLGLEAWRETVTDVVARLRAALEPDEIVLGGGNVHQLQGLPPGCRAGSNADAFTGGFRLWEQANERAHQGG